jgi:lipopolysaccharide export system protein LptC
MIPTPTSSRWLVPVIGVILAALMLWFLAATVKARREARETGR